MNTIPRKTLGQKRKTCPFPRITSRWRPGISLYANDPRITGDRAAVAYRDDVLLTGGGIIPQEDMDALATLGVGRLFGPGAATTELVDYIRTWFAERNPQPA